MKLLSLALLVPAATSALDAGNYDHMVEVDAAAGYKVHWKIAGDSINLAVQAKTTGWVGFGIGETTSGSMKGADIVTGSVVAGKGSIVDRFSLAEVMPQADMSQDWTLVASEEANGVTTLEMSRKLKTEDTQDREIGAQIHAVIVAWGSSDDFGYHAGRLATRIDFNNPTKSDPMAAFKADTTKYKTFEIMSNHTMTAEQTVYIDVDRKIFDSACADDDAFWYKISPGLSCSTMLTYARAANATATQPCTTMMTGQNGDLYNVADTGACDKTCGICDEGDVDPGMLAAKKYHIVGIEHIVAKNTEDHVHHFTLSMEGGGYPPTVYAWARGGEAFVPPSECGFLLDPSSGFTTFRLNVHYDNPHGKNTGEVDASGIRMYYTETLRDNDCGVVTLGDPTVVDRNLPKGITRSEYHCSTPDTGFAPMNVFGSFLHMHSVGKRIYTEIWRNGSKLQTTSQIDFWDDGFQLTNPVSAVVKPGDVLKTVCIHNAPQETVYGKASDEEMCMDFMFYYPKMSVDNCGYGGRRTGNSYGKLESNTTLSSDPVWFGTPKGGAECPMINGLFPGGECTLPTGSSTCTDLEAFYTCMAENQCQTECESALAAARNNDANYCPNAACKATEAAAKCDVYTCKAGTKKANAADIEGATDALCCDATAAAKCDVYTCKAGTKKSNAADIEGATDALCCDATDDGSSSGGSGNTPTASNVVAPTSPEVSAATAGPSRVAVVLVLAGGLLPLLHH